MFRIEDKNLYLTRGDTAYLKVNFKTQREIQSLVFSVKKRYYDTDYKFQIAAVMGNTFIIAPEHTKDLDFGKYYYDIQLTTTLGEVFTLQQSDFYITNEVSK